MGTTPLRGIRVLDLSRMIPGALCTLLLADLGAEVVKVESPGRGDGLRGMYGPGFDVGHVALNRGKRSVTLDLGADGAGAVLDRLVASAHVLVESHRPGQLDAQGIGYEALRAAHPHIVWCAVTGFGDVGPNAQQPGHDLTYLGTSGLLAVLADGRPTAPRTTVALPLAASAAATGILAALLEAQRTGQGTRVEVDMTDSAMWLRSEDVARAANAPGPGFGSFSSRNVYECADGRFVTVAASEPKTWATLCAALGVPELADHRYGLADDAPVLARLEEVFRSRDAAAWVAEPGYAGGVGPVNDAADLLTEPQVVERGNLVALEGSGHRVLGTPIRLGGATTASTTAATPPPDLGADTDAVLTGAGFSAAEVAELRQRGVLG